MSDNMSDSVADDTVELACSVGCPPCRPHKQRRHTLTGSAQQAVLLPADDNRGAASEEGGHSVLHKPRGRLAALQQVLDEKKKLDRLHCHIYLDLLKEHRQLQTAHQALQAQRAHDLQQQAQQAHGMQQAQQVHRTRQAQQVHDLQQEEQQEHDVQQAHGQEAQGQVASRTGAGTGAGIGSSARGDAVQRLQQEVSAVQQREAASLAQFCRVALMREGMLMCQLQAVNAQLAAKLARQGEEVQQQCQLAAQAQAALREGRQQWEHERRQLLARLAAATGKMAAAAGQQQQQQQQRQQCAEDSDVLVCTGQADPAATAAAVAMAIRAAARNGASQAGKEGQGVAKGPATPAGPVAVAAAAGAAAACMHWDCSCSPLDSATVAAAADYAAAAHRHAGGLAATLPPAASEGDSPACAPQAASGSIGGPEAALVMGSGSGSDSGAGDEDAAALAAAISAALAGCTDVCDWCGVLEAPHTNSLPLSIVEDLLR